MAESCPVDEGPAGLGVASDVGAASAPPVIVCVLPDCWLPRCPHPELLQAPSASIEADAIVIVNKVLRMICPACP